MAAYIERTDLGTVFLSWDGQVHVLAYTHHNRLGEQRLEFVSDDVDDPDQIEQIPGWLKDITTPTMAANLCEHGLPRHLCTMGCAGPMSFWR